ncbi:MAG: helix-turn-helix transcriptional regulator [Micropruina sp.]|nr:helix-turn-helix domain-containing protein [Micropruina sp.]
MGREAIDLVPYARDAAQLMGANVRVARINRRWTTSQLAEHVGCSRHTIAAIEHRKPSVAFGHVLNACAALGIQLFVPDPQELARLSRAQMEIVRLMPNRVMPKGGPSDDF